MDIPKGITTIKIEKSGITLLMNKNSFPKNQSGWPYPYKNCWKMLAKIKQICCDGHIFSDPSHY